MIIYRGFDPKVIKAVDFCNVLFNGSFGFYSKINEVDRFDMSDASPAEISKIYRDVWRIYSFEYVVYKPCWRWSKAIGYYSKSKPFIINVNYYKLKKMSKHQIVGNIAHELGHAADHFSDKSFNHGNNSRLGKENTFQYFVGRLAKSISIIVTGKL